MNRPYIPVIRLKAVDVKSILEGLEEEGMPFEVRDQEGGEMPLDVHVTAGDRIGIYMKGRLVEEYPMEDGRRAGHNAARLVLIKPMK